MCSTNTLTIDLVGPQDCGLDGPQEIRLGQEGCFTVSYAVPGLPTRWGGTDKGMDCAYCAGAQSPTTTPGDNRRCFEYPADQPDLVGTYTRRLDILHNGQVLCTTATRTIHVRPAQ